jgi:aminopeptidase YwaD
MSKTKKTNSTLDQQLAGLVFTSTDVRSNFEVLCDDLGSRFAGTEEEESAARFLEDKLHEYGLSNVHREEFEYHGWTRGEARLRVIKPWSRDLDCLSLPMSPPGSVRGEVVDLDRGGPEDFQRQEANLRDNIALVNIENPVSAARWIQRIEKYNRSVLGGARAFIFMGNEEGYGPVTGALGFDRWGLIPGIAISRETGLQLRRLLRRGNLEIEIETTDQQVSKTSWNVVGDIEPADLQRSDMVVFGSHYDAHDLAQGAHDPTSGLVASLEAARVLALNSKQLKRPLRTILFGVEELGLIGAQAYVDGHEGDLDRTRFMLNLDAAGGPDEKCLFLYGQDTREYFRTLSAEFDEDLIVDMERSPLREPEHISADHYPFMAAGLPTGFIRDPGLSISTGFYHTAHDTVDKIRLIDMREAAFLAAQLIWRIANDDHWPFTRTSPAERDKLQREYEWKEVCEIEAAVEKLREEMEEKLS